MKDLDAKLRLKARNELLKWLHKPHEEPELSDFEQGYLEATKMLAPLIQALDSCSHIQWASIIAGDALKEFNEELES